MPGDMSASLSDLWAKSRESVLARVAVIEAAALALRTASLDDELRAAAESAAHKLAGVAGTFGYDAATELAHEAESALEGTAPISEECATRLSEIARLLHEQLSAGAI